MAISEENNRKIQDYLAGTMPARERSSFEQACTSDSDLAAELALYRKIYYGLEEQAVLSFKQKIEEGVAQRKLREQSTPNAKRLMLFFLLIVIGGIAYLGYYLMAKPTTPFPQSEEPSIPTMDVTPIDTIGPVPEVIATEQGEEAMPIEPQAEHWAETDKQLEPADRNDTIAAERSAYQQLAMAEFEASTFVFRGQAGTVDSLDQIQDAFQYFAQARSSSSPFEKEQYLQQVIGLLGNLDVKKNEKLLLTRAQAYFQIGSYQLAIADFANLRSSFLYGYDADWGLVLCYLAQMPTSAHQFDEAIQIIIQNESHDFRSDASQLREKLLLRDDD